MIACALLTCRVIALHANNTFYARSPRVRVRMCALPLLLHEYCWNGQAGWLRTAGWLAVDGRLAGCGRQAGLLWTAGLTVSPSHRRLTAVSASHRRILSSSRRLIVGMRGGVSFSAGPALLLPVHPIDAVAGRGGYVEPPRRLKIVLRSCLRSRLRGFGGRLQGVGGSGSLRRTTLPARDWAPQGSPGAG